MQYEILSKRLKDMLRTLAPVAALWLLPLPAYAADAGFTQFRKSVV